jgi:hypothetical protein
VTAPTSCPLCSGPAYGWLTLPDPGSRPTVGLPAGVGRVIDRCEECGAGIQRGPDPVDLEAELERVTSARPDGSLALVAPNRASLQAWIGADGWAALDRWRGRLLLTPAAVPLLAERTGHAIKGVSFPAFAANQGTMWQTLLNGLTFHPNFAREVRAGRLRPSGGRGPASFAIDALVTVLAGPLVAIVSVPLELAAVIARRGGELSAELER